MTDGTAAGTHLLADLDNVSTAGSDPANLFLLPDNIASDAPTGLDISALQDSGPSSTDNVTSTTTLTITGLAAPDVRVTLKDGTSFVGQVQSDATTGAWSITASGLDEGTHRFTATATNASLNTSAYPRRSWSKWTRRSLWWTSPLPAGLCAWRRRRSAAL